MRRNLSAKDWIILATVIRVIAAFTRVNWHYPDEWYQTVEFAQLILGRSAIYSHEMGLHLRNLSWPLVLSLPLVFSNFLAPHWTQLRLIASQLLAGGFDLLALFAFARLSRHWTSGTSETSLWRNLGFALLILPWFRVQDSVSLGAEHISACLIWIALAALESGSFFLAGLLSVAIFSVKYPAGLVGLGLGLALFASGVRDKKFQPFVRFSAGTVLGLVVFGIPDWLIYGRPWESLWMYLQYNVFTGAGTTTFGRQSLYPYFDFLRSRWLRVLFPFGVLLLVGGIAATVRDLKKLKPWAWAFFTYFLGHLLISHREARFMWPAETLLLWGVLQYGEERFRDWKPVRWVKVLAVIIFIANLPLFLKATIGESGTLNPNYFEVDQRLSENHPSCAIISQRALNSFLIPTDAPAVAYFGAERRIPTFAQAETKPLAWFGQAPRCKEGDSILLLVDRPDVGWIGSGCKLQTSGILEILPQPLWETFLHRGWVSGPWYACPPTTLSHFKNQSEESPLVQRFKRFESLPPLGTSERDLIAFGLEHDPSHQCRWTCP